MRPFPDCESSTIEETSKLISDGVLSCVDVVQRCLDRIDEWESKVHAWVVVDQEGALARARELDRHHRDWGGFGALHGIPIGIKDIIDVKGLPTSAGARRWGGGKPAEANADLVTRLRASGAIILGKTVTTPYAWIDPPPTRNPWNLDRTPGGSSSGSAVAVATGMCLGAFGTQTGGSIIRPAAFCGVVGFKPRRSAISTEGIVPFAPSLDTPGPFALSVEGVRRLFTASKTHGYDFSRIDPSKNFFPKADHPRMARLRGFFEELADPEMTRAMDVAQALLEQAGAIVSEIELPTEFEGIHRAHRVVMAAEAAVTHAARFAELPDDYPPRIAELIEEGRPILASDYIRSRNMKSELLEGFWASAGGIGHRLHGLGDGYDAFLMPAALGSAPGPFTTGDPVFNSPWTYLDLPSIALPIGLSDDGLPLAVQLVGYPLDELPLLDVAAWCEKVFRDRTPRD